MQQPTYWEISTHHLQCFPQPCKVSFILSTWMWKQGLRERLVTFYPEWQNRDSNLDMTGSKAFIFSPSFALWFKKKKCTWQKKSKDTKRPCNKIWISFQPSPRFLFPRPKLCVSLTNFFFEVVVTSCLAEMDCVALYWGFLFRIYKYLEAKWGRVFCRITNKSRLFYTLFRWSHHA